MGRRPRDTVVDAAAPARHRSREHPVDDRRVGVVVCVVETSACRTGGFPSSSSRSSSARSCSSTRSRSSSTGCGRRSTRSPRRSAPRSRAVTRPPRRRSTPPSRSCSPGAVSPRARSLLAGAAVAIAVGVACEPRHARRPLALGRHRRPRLRLGLVRALRDRLRRPVPQLRRAGGEGDVRAAERSPTARSRRRSGSRVTRRRAGSAAARGGGADGARLRGAGRAGGSAARRSRCGGAARWRSAATARRRASRGRRRPRPASPPDARPRAGAASRGRALVEGDDVHLGVVEQRMGVQVRRADREPRSSTIPILAWT